MFDDSKRLDALEAQMKAVQKGLEEIPGKIDKVQKEITEDMTKRFINKSKDIEETDKTATKAGTDAKSVQDELKKALQRIAALEQQVKKLSK